MDLLDFARGPALWASLAIFVGGTAWRLAGLLRRPPMPDHSPARDGARHPFAAAAVSALRGLVPTHNGIAAGRRFAALNAWVFHIGLALVFLFYAPHIAFIRRITGVSWPALPDAFMYLASGVTMVGLGMALWHRVTDPVRRMLSNTDDYISWTVTFLPFITGMAAAAEPAAALMAREAPLYRAPLALHLLTLELLLVWFPFGKLFHAVLYPFARGATGMRFDHRGVQT